VGGGCINTYFRSQVCLIHSLACKTFSHQEAWWIYRQVDLRCPHFQLKCHSLMKWWRTSMCSVLACWTRLLVSFMALSLSHSNGTYLNLLPKSSKVTFIQSNCAQWLLAKIYSTLAIESATPFCFFDDKDTSDLPNSWHVPDVLFLSTLHPAQLESDYPTNSKFDPFGCHKPTFCVCFKYLNILFVAFKWLSLGEAWNLAHMHT
jgi:hypothetical protein